MNGFNPMRSAEAIVLRRAARAPVHLSIVIESVRVSDVSRLVSGYDAVTRLLEAGLITVTAGMVAVA